MGPFPRNGETEDVYVDRVTGTFLVDGFDDDANLRRLHQYFHDERICRLLAYAKGYMHNGDVYTTSDDLNHPRPFQRPELPNINLDFQSSGVWRDDGAGEPEIDRPAPGQASFFDYPFAEWITEKLEELGVKSEECRSLCECGGGDRVRGTHYAIPETRINGGLPLVGVQDRDDFGLNREQPIMRFSGTAFVSERAQLATCPFVRMKVYRELIVDQNTIDGHLGHSGFDEPDITQVQYTTLTMRQKIAAGIAPGNNRYTGPVVRNATWPMRNNLPINPRRDAAAEFETFREGVPQSELVSARLTI
jgi:hypothetical protein